MEPVFLKNTTLHERQAKFYNGHECPYCGNICDFVDSIEVYRESHGMIYLCRPCKAWVGVHHKNTDQAYGFVATKELRDLRHLAHQWFDPLWQRKMNYGVNKKQAQIKARKWLAGILGIDVVECHMGMFNEDLCRRTIEECKKHTPTKEQLEIVKKEIETRKAMIRFIADSMDINIKEWDINGVTQYAFEKEGKKFFYHFRDGTGYWEGKTAKFAPLKMPIDEFLDQNF